jgi:DnaK suppressor protein
VNAGDAMTLGRLAADRTRVVAQIAALTRNFDALVEGSLLVNTDDEHDPEGATIAFERAQVSALLKQAEVDLAALDEAIERLEQGSYGRCEVCDQPIGEERLEAIPSATQCITCARIKDTSLAPEIPCEARQTRSGGAAGRRT